MGACSHGMRTACPIHHGSATATEHWEWWEGGWGLLPPGATSRTGQCRAVVPAALGASPPPPFLPASCDFERDMCGWSSPSDPLLRSFAWGWKSGVPLAKYPGPEQDHTLGTKNGRKQPCLPGHPGVAGVSGWGWLGLCPSVCPQQVWFHSSPVPSSPEDISVPKVKEGWGLSVALWTSLWAFWQEAGCIRWAADLGDTLCSVPAHPGHYVHFDTAVLGLGGTAARLESQHLPAAADSCLRFWYHMDIPEHLCKCHRAGRRVAATHDGSRRLAQGLQTSFPSVGPWKLWISSSCAVEMSHS